MEYANIQKRLIEEAAGPMVPTCNDLDVRKNRLQIESAF